VPLDRLSRATKRFDWRVALALGATYACFGSGAAAAAAAIQTLPPFLMVAARGLIAGAILTVWALQTGAARPTWRQWRGAALIGILILGCGAGGGTYGQLTVPSGVAGVLSALLPLFAACIGYVAFRERLAGRSIVGLAIGFAGVGLLLRPGANLDVFGVAVIVTGQLAWATGAELAPRAGLPDDPRAAAGLELLAGGGALFVVATLFGDRRLLHSRLDHQLRNYC
jgi:drug/metabolite transporter (DMT)-like permease